jgi:hypothetical protein
VALVAEAPGDEGVMQAEPLPTSEELLQAALEYARLGLPVFPCHTPINGVCDCWKGPQCEETGKHPWTKNGLSDASIDELQIRRWWKEHPCANIGIALPKGWVAVDVDSDRAFHVLAEQGKHLPATAIQKTGGGTHYVYRCRELIRSRNKYIPDSEPGAHDGVDLRGPGGYILAHPSLHASGRIYEWSVPLSQVEIAPQWLEDLSKESGGTQVGQRLPVDFERLLNGLDEGERKWEILRGASKLRAADVPIDIAIRMMQDVAAACRPPLDASQAERKVREAYAKYPINASAQDLPAGVTLLARDSVMVEFETCRFVFSDLEKAGRELHAEMEVKNLLPGVPQEPYTLRLNLLSMGARESARREIEHVLGNPVKGHWTALFSRAITKAQSAFLSVDRSIKTSEIEPPAELGFVVPDICVEDGINILFGEGSAGKTWLLMKMALAVSRGDPFLGRGTRQRNVLYFDCETGRRTYALRMRRICEGEGLTMADADRIRYWFADGLPFEDQVDAIKRCCEENQIEFICLDHIAAACSGDANEQAVASRFARAVGKVGLPVMALAHITGADMKNPEMVNKPFGSVYWHNNSRRTIFVLRQQEDESSVADLGLYPKKVNDGKRPRPFGARITFSDPSGPITVDADDLADKGVLSTARGPQHVIWDMLAAPMPTEEIAAAMDKSERYVKDVMKAHHRMFVEIPAKRGVKQQWARVDVRAPYPEPDDDETVDDELPW